jgi:hypothetical protein
MSLQCVILLGLAVAPGIQGDEPPSQAAAASWVRAVEQHRPGTADEAATAIASWQAATLESAFRDLRDYLTVTRGGGVDQVNDVLARGALLHTDIAILAPDRARAFRGFRTWSAQGGVRGLDGEHVGYEPISGHWEFARVLLDGVRPDPARDAFVRSWYVAVATYLQREALLAISIHHLARARAVLGNDADIAFLSGAMHETFASPRHQAVLRALVTNSPNRLALDSPDTELRRAERYFRESLRERPGMIEARVHLGRVLAMLGRQEQAAATLRESVAQLEEAADPVVAYYAHLFLAEAERTLGRRDAARAGFEAALGLYPGAQSPRLALSALARDGGDRGAAWAALRPLAHPGEEERRDPWWIYWIAHGRDADTLLAALRAPFRASGASRH